MNNRNIIEKHAYLIIAHNEFEVLSMLVNVLDDDRNDIFIHFDAKVKELPDIKTRKASLIILNDRVNVCWGDVSQIESEYKLWECAVGTSIYKFYHIISGTHFPLKSQDYIHGFYEKKDKNVFQRMQTNESEIEIKIRKYNFFSKYMMSNSSPHSYKIGRLLWNICLKPQKVLGIKRNRHCEFHKSSNWVSLKHDAVIYMLNNKKSILTKYRYTFCGDEFFVLSELMGSPLRNDICFVDNVLRQDFVHTNPKIYLPQDYDLLMNSGCLYARKFSANSIELLKRIEIKLQVSDDFHCNIYNKS